MHSPHWLLAVLTVVLFNASGFQSASAGLPALDAQPWIGYFAVSQNRRFRLTITNHGKTTLTPMNDKGAPVGETLTIPIIYGIEEILPGGATRMKTIKPDSLESAEPPTDQLEKTVIRGKVTGDAAFEVTIHQEQGTISIGGRVTDTGTLTKNPLRFTIRAKIPNVYLRDERNTKKELRDFAKKTRGDRLELTWTDGNRVRETFEKPVDVTSGEINGPGIAGAAIEISAYKGKKLRFTASKGSAITLWNDKTAPLHEGFSLHWLADTAKDPEGNARFSFQVK